MVRENGKSTIQNTQKHRNQHDPQIRQPDLRFAESKTAKQQKTGQGPNNNTQTGFAVEHSDISHRVNLKNMQN